MLALLDVLSDFIEPFIGLLFEKVWKKYNNENTKEETIMRRRTVSKVLGIILATAALTMIIYSIYFLIHWYS